jgi:hypothetical protein
MCIIFMIFYIILIMLLEISIIQAFYIIFMFNYFKTKINFAHPLSNFSSDYFYHPIDISNKPRSMICKFGKDISWILAALFILRGLRKINKKYFNVILIALFIGSLINFNALIYLLPIFFMEAWLIFYQHDYQ